MRDKAKREKRAEINMWMADNRREGSKIRIKEKQHIANTGKEKRER